MSSPRRLVCMTRITERVGSYLEPSLLLRVPHHVVMKMLLSPRLLLHGARMMPCHRLRFFKASSPFVRSCSPFSSRILTNETWLLGEQTPYLDDYLASRMGAGFPLPLEPHMVVSSSVQPSYVAPESGLSGELSIDMWTDAPFGFR